MRLQHIDRSKLVKPAFGVGRPWLAAASTRLLELPDHPRSRFLITTDDGWILAILGLELEWVGEGRLERATIRVLEVDPDHLDRGLDSRLVRVAQDIAHIYGCDRVSVAAGLERWNDGHSRLATGRFDFGRGSSLDFTPFNEGSGA